MRNDICFPCLEHPTRCLFLSVPFDTKQQPQALSCNRKGEILASDHRKRWEEWYLIAEDLDAGIYRIVNAAHNTVLVWNPDGSLSAADESFVEDAASWTVQDQDDNDNGMVQIRSFVGNCYLSCNGSRIQTHSNSKCPTTQWRLEYLTGELCHIQLAHSRRLVMCDNLGTLKLSSVKGGWEVFRFLEAGNNQVRISSWTHHHKLLACNAYGVVQTTEDRWSDESLWRIQKAPKGLDGVLIMSVPTGRLLRSDGTSLSSAGYIDGVNTTWQLSAAHQQKYYISSIGYDKRVSLIKETCLKTTTHRRDCEVWMLEKVDRSSFVRLKSVKFGRFLRYNGHELSVGSENDRAADITSKWRIVESPTGQGVCIVSAMEPFLALSCNQKGDLEAVDHQGPFESWNLEPCMPDSLEQWQINLMIGGAIGAALLGPAIAVSMMGLGAETVAAGTITTMAAETAVAGEIAAASGTATAAAGLTLSAATAAMGTGAALGLSATGIVVATSQRDRGEGTDLKQAEQERPFCEWRSW